MVRANTLRGSHFWNRYPREKWRASFCRDALGHGLVEFEMCIGHLEEDAKEKSYKYQTEVSRDLSWRWRIVCHQF